MKPRIWLKPKITNVLSKGDLFQRCEIKICLKIFKYLKEKSKVKK
jgi:hypothetical protein